MQLFEGLHTSVLHLHRSIEKIHQLFLQMFPDLQETLQVPRVHSVGEDRPVENDGDEGADRGDDHCHDEHAAYASGKRFERYTHEEKLPCIIRGLTQPSPRCLCL